ncbi:hypothetical protein EYR36_011713 [Pleurotus pulmonarius]|nr:hypothetical protein EYR36_011713 [Pleurotus pulmonarius]KAF4607386.1 hypothetical protein EYR38_001456 [Pleurotus pulmonarius]
MSKSDLLFGWVSADDLSDAIEIEKQGFPEDEAASIEAFRYRQSQAGNLFLGGYLASGEQRRLIGYVCSTLSPATTLTHESMSTHVPGSSSICIHSICVAKEHTKQGVGSKLLKEYVSRLQVAAKDPSTSYDRILLIVHEELRGFYEKAGFEWVGESSVKHGSRPWFEMRKILDTSNDATALPPAEIALPSQGLPPGLWEALQKSSTSPNKPVPRPLSSFHGGTKTLIQTTDAGISTNKVDILCPRPGCGSIILKRGVAKWLERSSVQMEPSDQPGNPLLSKLPPPPQTSEWWLAGPSPMVFENIGFSRPVTALPPSDTGARLKLLICGECDLGPLGWCEEGGSEYWLACSRVGYRE